jgi:hypothetical protein
MSSCYHCVDDAIVSLTRRGVANPSDLQLSEGCRRKIVYPMLRRVWDGTGLESRTNVLMVQEDA